MKIREGRTERGRGAVAQDKAAVERETTGVSHTQNFKVAKKTKLQHLEKLLVSPLESGLSHRARFLLVSCGVVRYASLILCTCDVLCTKAMGRRSASRNPTRVKGTTVPCCFSPMDPVMGPFFASVMVSEFS